jgi:hypothetical protein
MAEDDKDSQADTDYMTTTTAIPNDRNPWNMIKIWKNNNNMEYHL